MKAIDILKKGTSIEDRAENYVKTAKRNLQKSFLDPITDRIEKTEDTIRTQLDFNLDADLNKGVKPVTSEEAQARFEAAMKLSYDLVLLRAEFNAKQTIFDSYFAEDVKA